MANKIHHYVRLQSGEQETIILTMKLWFVLDDDNYQIWLKDVTEIQYKDITKEDEVLMASQSAQEKKITTKYFEGLKKKYKDEETVLIKRLVYEILYKYYLSQKPNSSKFNKKKVAEETRITLDKIEKDGKLRYILSMVENEQELTMIKEWILKNYCKQ